MFSRRMGSTVVRDQDEDRLPAEGGGVRRTGTPGRGVQDGPLTTWSCRSRAIMTYSGVPISLPCADQTLLFILCDRASSSAAGSQAPCLRMGHVISCWLGGSAWCWSLPCTRLQSPIVCSACLILPDNTLVFLLQTISSPTTSLRFQSESELGVPMLCPPTAPLPSVTISVEHDLHAFPPTT